MSMTVAEHRHCYGAFLFTSAAILPLFSRVARTPRRRRVHAGGVWQDSKPRKMFQIIKTTQFNNSNFNICDLFLRVIGK